MSNTLLPCPFCGKCAHTGHYRSRHKDDEHYLVMCDYCFARTVGSTPEEAIAAWNRRTGKGINVTTNADRCVICGTYIPEGRQVCVLCIDEYSQDKGNP